MSTSNNRTPTKFSACKFEQTSDGSESQQKRLREFAKSMLPDHVKHRRPPRISTSVAQQLLLGTKDLLSDDCRVPSQGPLEIGKLSERVQQLRDYTQHSRVFGAQEIEKPVEVEPESNSSSEEEEDPAGIPLSVEEVGRSAEQTLASFSRGLSGQAQHRLAALNRRYSTQRLDYISSEFYENDQDKEEAMVFHVLEETRLKCSRRQAVRRAKSLRPQPESQLPNTALQVSKRAKKVAAKNQTVDLGKLALHGMLSVPSDQQYCGSRVEKSRRTCTVDPNPGKHLSDILASRFKELELRINNLSPTKSNSPLPLEIPMKGMHPDERYSSEKKYSKLRAHIDETFARARAFSAIDPSLRVEMMLGNTHKSLQRKRVER